MATQQRPRQARSGNYSQTLQPESFSAASYSENSLSYASDSNVSFPSVPSHSIMREQQQQQQVVMPSLTAAELAMLYSSEPSSVNIVAQAYPVSPNSIGNQVPQTTFTPPPSSPNFQQQQSYPTLSVPPTVSTPPTVVNVPQQQQQSPFAPVDLSNSSSQSSSSSSPEAQPRRRSGFRSVLMGMLEGAETAITDIMTTDEIARHQRAETRRLETSSFVQENPTMHYRELLPFRLNRTDMGMFVVSIAYGSTYSDIRWMTIGNKTGYATELEAIRIGEGNGVPRWSSTQEHEKCEYCGTMFGILFLRQTHHCRNCGRVVCSRCSTSDAPDPNINPETHQGPVSWASSMVPPSFQMNDASPFEKQRCRICLRCHKSLVEFRFLLKAGDFNGIRSRLEWTRALPAGEGCLPRRVAWTVNLHCPMTVFGDNEYPIHLACESGNLDIVRYLLEDRLVAIRPQNAAPCIRRTSDGLTPFGCAANAGHVETCLYLLQRHNCSIREVYNIFALWRLTSALLYGPNFTAISSTLPDATKQQEILSYIEMIERLEGEEDDPADKSGKKRKKKKALLRPYDPSYIQDMIDLPFVQYGDKRKAAVAAIITATTGLTPNQLVDGGLPAGIMQAPQLLQTQSQPSSGGRPPGVTMYTAQPQLQLGPRGPMLTSAGVASRQAPAQFVEATVVQATPIGNNGSTTTAGNDSDYNPYLQNHLDEWQGMNRR